MELDRITTVVRPRTRWEASDLGLLMARAWWGPLMRVWLVVTLPLFVLLHLLLPGSPLVALLLFWWLKPLWERPLLHLLSRALFGQVPTLGETLRAFPALAARQWFASLTWRRLSLSRSMELPVVQLEGLAGRERRRRLQLLHGLRGSGGGWLTLVGVHVESGIALALLALVMLFVPAEVAPDWGALLLAESPALTLAGNGAVYLGMTLVAPFYVAAGFSLYLHRRIWLEGWDIEIAFRRLQQRLTRGGQRRGGLVVALLCAALLWGESPPLLAQEPLSPARSREVVEAVVAQEVFHDRVSHYEIIWPWGEWSWELELFPDTDFTLLQGVVLWLASSGRILLWALAIALLLIFLARQRRWLRRYAGVGGRAERRRESPPEQLFGLALGRDTLPDDLLAEVRALWQGQQSRAALSLLYRAVLAQLMARQGVRFRQGDTEGECVRRVARVADAELSRYFEQLTHHWQRLAYAHQLPDEAVMERLCRGWQQHFEAGAR